MLRLDNESEGLSLPIKSQRQCNAVAFNPESLLATGLERVRNDFCLNVYDIVHWAGSQKTSSLLHQQPAHEPVRKLATSEGITSIKFFQEEPNVLVAGVKGTCVRIYDLRESSGNPALQYHTTCVHNIAVDPCNANYFASAGPVKDCTVQVWDRRSVARQPASAPPSAIQFASPDSPLLELKEVFKPGGEPEAPSIWSLRYSIAEQGSLGVLGSNGSVRIFETKRSLADSRVYYPSEDTTSRVEQDLYVDRTETIGAPPHRPRRGSKGSVEKDGERVLAFDFINVLSCNRKSSAITFSQAQEIGIRELNIPIPAIQTSWSYFVVHGASNSASTRKSRGFPAGIKLHRPSRRGTIAALREAAKARLESPSLAETSKSPTSPTADGWYGSDEDINDGWTEDVPSTTSSPVKPDSKNIFDRAGTGIRSGQIEDTLILADAARRRCLEGYLFNAEKNINVLRDELELQWMWSWIKGL